MSVKISIYRKTPDDTFEAEADQVLAATRTFLYWTIWLPVEEATGEQEVVFIPSDSVRMVRMTGEIDEAEGSKAKLSVVNLDDHRPAS